MSSQPGWYVDPQGSGQQRYWDGSQWTSWTSGQFSSVQAENSASVYGTSQPFSPRQGGGEAFSYDTEIRLLKSKRSQVRNMLLFWLIITSAGIIITIAGFSEASKNGGTYAVFWGAILFGSYRLIKQLITYSKLTSAIDALRRS